jgi:molybdopterin synthase catalytic subunit
MPEQEPTPADRTAPLPDASPGCFRVTDAPLSLDEVVRAVSGPRRGGVVTFTGIVRSETRGRAVVRLEYEAYAPMAEQVLARIGAEVGAAHGAAVAIVHRVGVLVPGEAAVVIACAAPHRKPAFRACEAALEELKREVPIWKREVFEDGAVWVGLGP